MLGELGRYPVFIPTLEQCLKYQYQIERMDRSTLIYNAISDMRNNPHVDSWYTRVEKIRNLFGIKNIIL